MNSTTPFNYQPVAIREPGESIQGTILHLDLDSPTPQLTLALLDRRVEVLQMGSRDLQHKMRALSPDIKFGGDIDIRALFRVDGELVHTIDLHPAFPHCEARIDGLDAAA